MGLQSLFFLTKNTIVARVKEKVSEIKTAIPADIAPPVTVVLNDIKTMPTTIIHSSSKSSISE